MGVASHELQVDDMRAGSVVVDFTCTSPNAGSALAAVAALGDGGLCFDALSKAVGVTVKPKGGLGIRSTQGSTQGSTTAEVKVDTPATAAGDDDDDDDETDTDVDGDADEDEDEDEGGEALEAPPVKPTAVPKAQGQSRTPPKVGEIIIVEHGPSAGRLAKVTKVRADGKFEAKVLKRYARSASLPTKGEDGEPCVAQTAPVAVEANESNELERTIAAVKLSRHAPKAPPSWREGMIGKESKQPKDTAGRECPVQ